MKTFTKLSLALLTIGQMAFAESLVVYSARKEQLLKPVIELYEKETGVKVQLLTGKAGALLQKLKMEGKRTPADVFITVDAGNLWHAANEGILAPIQSETLMANVPAHLRDPNNLWVGLSVRSRTVVYNTDRVKASDLSTYEDLASAKWKNRLALRTSKKVYNQSLVAMMIEEKDEAKTEEVVKGWVANINGGVHSSDTKALEALLAGKGDVAIVNTYYFGRLLKKKGNLPLKIFWPNQQTSGVHVNVSGGAILKHSRNKAGALRFLEFCASEKAQAIFAGVNMEYPVNPKVKTDATVSSWGNFKGNTINVSKAGALQAKAVKLMDRAGYK